MSKIEYFLTKAALFLGMIVGLFGKDEWDDLFGDEE